eukprot:CAMPEP_0174261440 /NCGR_PEP_ID=MMETSP0439-20130205/11431_1 /TAXON_ID=0 /ORGANISM="Stereomyxa ramosa, Strain Chinc5" /LENGTH=247 /DNA_ID=CAMNT_0015345913 /DNA_START=19 /DNA_END=762 /DNA_ORIENTATION=-
MKVAALVIFLLQLNSAFSSQEARGTLGTLSPCLPGNATYQVHGDSVDEGYSSILSETVTFVERVSIEGQQVCNRGCVSFFRTYGDAELVYEIVVFRVFEDEPGLQLLEIEVEPFTMPEPLSDYQWASFEFEFLVSESIFFGVKWNAHDYPNALLAFDETSSTVADGWVQYGDGEWEKIEDVHTNYKAVFIELECVEYVEEDDQQAISFPSDPNPYSFPFSSNFAEPNITYFDSSSASSLSPFSFFKF